MPYYRCPECGLTTHSVAGYSTVGMCASCAASLPFEQRLDPAVTAMSSPPMRPKAAPNGAFVLEEDGAR
jgi:hypothetical protein